MTYDDFAVVFTYDPETGLISRRTPSRGHAPGPLSQRPNADGYLAVKFRGECFLQHRIAWLLAHREWPAVIDHINGVRNDNRLTNLRSCTTAQNAYNTPIARGIAGYKGVCKSTRGPGWHASINVGGGKQRYLGSFRTADEASAAYVTAAIELHGSFFCLRIAHSPLAASCIAFAIDRKHLASITRTAAAAQV